MKKYTLLLFMAFLGGSFLFTSCSTDENRGIEAKSIDQKVSESDNFRNAVEALTDLAAVSANNNWADRIDEIEELSAKIQNGNFGLEEIAAIEDALGISIEAFSNSINNIGKSLGGLYDELPELGDIESAERQAIFSLAIDNSSELTDMVAGAGSANLRAGCFWRDLCNGIVGIAALIGGPQLCEAIGTAIGIPFVGTIVCAIVTPILKDILTGICNTLPC